MSFRINTPSPTDIAEMLIYITPYVLFFIYVIACHKNFSASFLIPLTFIILTIGIIYSIVYTIIGWFRPTFDDLSSEFLLLSAYIFAIIAGFMAFKNTVSKVFIIIAMSVCLLERFISAVNSIDALEFYIYNELYYEFALILLSLVTPILFYVAVLILGANNTLRPKSNSALRPGEFKCAPVQPVYRQSVPEVNNGRDRTVDPSYALRALNEKYTRGQISKEAYESQRETILKFM